MAEAVMSVRVPATSVEGLPVWISAFVDPTAAPVAAALVEAGDVAPAPGAFTAATWANDPLQPNVAPKAATATSPASPGRYLAKAPLGTGGLTLDAGRRYELYAMVSAGSETPIMFAGLVEAT